jgi:alpha-beta hydrolase superfamily lysophospholipase
MSDSTDTIVLIHGLWMTPLSWEHWVARYESRGYKVLAPAWPGLEGELEQLRQGWEEIADFALSWATASALAGDTLGATLDSSDVAEAVP